MQCRVLEEAGKLAEKNLVEVSVEPSRTHEIELTDCDATTNL
jgi:hypothetical protein